MSFGASPSDIIIVVTFCRALYRKCRDAGGEYDEISREVRALHTVLRHLKYEVEAPESPLNRDRSIWGHQLAPIIGDCDFSLRQLDELLQKYGRISTAGDRSPSSPRVLWEKVKFGNNEMDQLGGIRVKLISHKTNLTLFLDTIQLHQSGKMATALDNHGGQLDVILDKVDGIAARMGQGSRSIMTSYDDDDKEVWKQFRRELVAEGFSSDILTQHKDVLRAYIREIDQKGLLEEMPPDDNSHPPGFNPERWLKSVPPQPTISTKDLPPSFESLNTPTDNVVSPKEMVIREDNMKFPQSMKLARPRPETKRDEGSSNQLEIPNQIVPLERSISGGEQSRAPALPQLMAPEHKEPLYLNTNGSSDEDSDNDSGRDDSRALIIRTSDLTTPGLALQLRPTGSPVSFRSYGSFGNDDAVRSMASRSKNPDFGTSPLLPGAIPIPIPARNLDPSLGTSPRPELIRLAPDQYGNEIPPDAKWTKIKRSLVSPAVLDQDGRRYEARPDFVAVLGVLSRAEIEHYAALSQELRAARQRRAMHPQSIPPTPPPRPILVQRPSNRNGRDTPSSDSSTSSSTSSSSSDSESHHRRRRRHKKRSYTPRQGYPNPFGQAPPSPLRSPVFTMGSGEQTSRNLPYSSNRGKDDGDKDRDRDRDGKERRRHSSHTPHPSSNSKSGNQREKEKGAREAKSRWRESLTAAGIGGAAVSLLNVLTEAAAEL